MDRPTPPPEAVLLRLVRTAAGMQSGAAAAGLARRFRRKFSPSRWSQIENGYETRGGEYKPVTANAATLAQMFAVVGGVTPERLESEGQRPDAAEILREILAHPDPQPPASRALAAVPDDADEDAVIEMLIAGEPDAEKREVMEQAWGWKAIPRADRLVMLRAYLERGLPEERGERRREPGALRAATPSS